MRPARYVIILAAVLHESLADNGGDTDHAHDPGRPERDDECMALAGDVVMKLQREGVSLRALPGARP